MFDKNRKERRKRKRERNLHLPSSSIVQVSFPHQDGLFSLSLPLFPVRHFFPPSPSAAVQRGRPCLRGIPSEERLPSEEGQGEEGERERETQLAPLLSVVLKDP